MISKVLNDINGISVYPVATLIIFFSFFTLVLLKVFTRKKAEYDEIARLPFDDGSGH
jgi:cytochrome c oxidase cbb3-type subunit IV